MLVLVEDISDRKRAERVLISERDQLSDEVQTTSLALGHTKEELRALTARLFTSQEEERRRDRHHEGVTGGARRAHRPIHRPGG